MKNMYIQKIYKEKDRKIINLLFLTEGEQNHYCWIKNFNKLNGQNISKNKHMLFWCYNCLGHFTSEKILLNHQENGCYNNPCAKMILPEKNDANIYYNEYSMKKQLRIPFVIYCHFEALTTPSNNKDSKNKHEQNKYQEHKCCSYGYKVVSCYEQYTKEYKSYRGENASQKFIEAICWLKKIILWKY